MKPGTKTFLNALAQILLAAAGAWLANKASKQNVPINPQETNKDATP